MDKLVLVSTLNSYGVHSAGRPGRMAFGLRKYRGTYRVFIPHQLCEEGDRADFLASKDGFAIRFSQNGQRAVSGKNTLRVVSVPKQISKHLEKIPDHVVDLTSEELPDRTWFFPFSQFLAFE